MGLDMYLGRYHKANLKKTHFNVEETERFQGLDSKYDVFEDCPQALRNIATEITVTNKYYNMEKISRDFAGGNKLRITGYSNEKTIFRDDEKGTEHEILRQTILDSYSIDKEETAYIVEGDYEVAYWRKANQIRNWFVEHMDGFSYDDNGEYYEVTKETLKELISDCKYVLSNHDTAEEIMPTSSGFFFGSTEYDDWYYQQLENTIEMCQKVIDETDWYTEVVVYTESW